MNIYETSLAVVSLALVVMALTVIIAIITVAMITVVALVPNGRVARKAITALCSISDQALQTSTSLRSSASQHVKQRNPDLAT
jgi:hypothetical protein